MGKENIISTKTESFAIKIIKFCKILSEEKREFVISKQLFRSATSIGANVRESHNAQSKANFINKLSIALKEADETAYWLELLIESEIIDKQQFEKLYKDLKEIIAILTASIKTLKSKKISFHFQISNFNLK